MKAVIQADYGPPERVLRVGEFPKPSPADDEVLVRVRAASVHPDVWHVVTGQPWVLRLMGAGYRRPKNPVPGTDFAGEVEAVGKSVTEFRPGDAVFGETHTGFQWVNGGSFAEYVCAPVSAIAHKPDNVGFEQAAGVPTSGIIAMFNLSGQGALASGQSVLVNGAGGNVGAIAVQLAKATGARVTAVDGTKKLEFLRRLGADEVIDYTKEDALARDARYDLIVDVASTFTLSQARRALAPGARYVLIGHDHYGTRGRRLFGSLPRFFGLIALTPFVSAVPKPNFRSPEKKSCLAELKALLETGRLTPEIARVFSLDEIVPALHYLATGEPVGKVIIRV